MIRFTIKIPYVGPRFRTEWHPLQPEGNFSILTRGSFNTKDEAIAWAGDRLNGTPYSIERVESTSEQLLDAGGGTRCGLNADWCVQAWHFGPAPLPNHKDGDYYICDLEDSDTPDAFEVVRRYYDASGGNDEIETVAQGTAETMLATVRAILKLDEKD